MEYIHKTFATFWNNLIHFHHSITSYVIERIIILTISMLQGTAERLLQHLVEEHSAVDPTYVEDFLLTYRTVLTSPMDVANKLHNWFSDPKLRDRVSH